MFMKWLKIFVVAISSVCFIQSSSASPMPPTATMTIEGRIQEISWYPKKHVKGIPGMSGSAGVDRTVPAHYKVSLIDTKVTSQENDNVPFTSGSPINIKLNHPKDDKFLMKNMQVRIIDFRMGGDEGGIWTSFKNIELLGKKEIKRAKTTNLSRDKINLVPKKHNIMDPYFREKQKTDPN